MSVVHHGVRPAAKAARAALGIVAFVAVAEVAHAVSVLAGPRGVIAGVAVIGVVFAACGLIHSLRRYRAPGLTRPAPVRLPERAERAEHLEPANSPS